MRSHVVEEQYSTMSKISAGVKGDPFLSPEPSLDRLHDYQLRGDILRALKAELPNFFGTFLDVGCGRMPYKSLIMRQPSRVERYIGADVEGSPYEKPDLIFDGREIPLESCSIDCAMATEVLEHCAEPGKLLSEINRVLKPGGFFFCTVPFVWPLHEVPNDYYRYTPYALRSLLVEAGFSAVQLKAHGGWDASLAEMLGLWVTYRGMLPWKRRLLSRCLRPLIRFLNEQDKAPEPCEGESSMLTGISCTARKPIQSADP
jgi:SAM-dependent methyltransferase